MHVNSPEYGVGTIHSNVLSLLAFFSGLQAFSDVSLFKDSWFSGFK